ncbi:MAG TPA: hypothetical protein VFQ73_00330, partial [Flavisolibacter sp.]|nr:hypothetical protein [Flavisolibacter sp.]
MRKTLLTLSGCILILSSFSQIANEFRSSTPRMIPYGQLPNEKDQTVQSLFIEQVWSPGQVKFKTNTVLSLPLIFDVYSNKLYFLQHNQIMEFAEPVTEFSMKLLKKSDTVTVAYRNNYPAVDKNTQETFYEILVDGDYQLLRCKAKTIHLYKDEEVPEEKRDYSKELFYALLPGNKMVQLKKDKEFVLKQMPGQAETIKTLAAEHKLKLKNEAQLVELFQLLNNQ